MAFAISFDVEIKKARNSLNNFQKRRHPQIIQRSLNRAIRGVVTDSGKILRKRINMKVGDIKRQFKITKAKPGVLWASARVKKRRPFNIARFGATPQRPRISGKRRLAGRGIRARAWEKRVLYKGGFIWVRGNIKTAFVRIKGQKVVPKKRTGGDGELRRYKRGPKKGQPIKREQLKALWGPSLWQVMEQNPSKKGESYYRDILPIARRRFLNEYNRQIKLVLDAKR